MAAGTLFTVLQAIPWRDVVDKAPVLVEGAKKLWGAVSKGRQGPAPQAEPAEQGGTDDGEPWAALKAQLTATRSELAQVHEQLAATSQLMQALAEQNALLVQRVELHRKRFVLLCWVCAATGAGLMGAWWHVLAKV